MPALNLQSNSTELWLYRVISGPDFRAGISSRNRDQSSRSGFFWLSSQLSFCVVYFIQLFFMHFASLVELLKLLRFQARANFEPATGGFDSSAIQLY